MLPQSKTGAGQGSQGPPGDNQRKCSQGQGQADSGRKVGVRAMSSDDWRRRALEAVAVMVSHHYQFSKENADSAVTNVALLYCVVLCVLSPVSNTF